MSKRMNEVEFSLEGNDVMMVVSATSTGTTEKIPQLPITDHYIISHIGMFKARSSYTGTASDQH